MRYILFFLLFICKTVNNAAAQIIINHPPVAQGVMSKPPRDTTPVRQAQIQVNSPRDNITLVNPPETITLRLPNPIDSIKLPKATEEDWAAYVTALDNLQQAVARDRYKNAENYFTIEVDLPRLKTINRQYLDRTAQLILRQLTNNIKFLTQLLEKKLEDSADLNLLTGIISNINELMVDYRRSVGLGFPQYILSSISINLSVIGKGNETLTNAQCYFVSKRTCRSINCKICEAGTDPCYGGNVNSIINQADISYDCSNQREIKVGMGFYHIFVVSNNRIIFYTAKTFGASDIRAGNNEIKLFVQ